MPTRRGFVQSQKSAAMKQKAATEFTKKTTPTLHAVHTASVSLSKAAPNAAPASKPARRGGRYR